MNNVNNTETENLLPSSTQEISEIRQEKDWKFYLVWLWRFIIFAITGSSSVRVTRFLLHAMNCTSEKWYYYICFFFAELIVYTLMIVSIGTILFQHRFFSLVAYKMWSWLLPKKAKLWCIKYLQA